ncbi:HAMP domain-containing sensor histidine kinase [Candidatus Njordibacter sp. Uisw_056]|uniref:sensor histidine kinase n=1 Tax=Candidatus Njordibacter sp. Uisw_056 TaxID=3230973 RepID=UPI003D52C3D8
MLENSEDWATYNSLIAAAKYDPTAQNIHFNESALGLLALPSSISLAEFIKVVTPALWQQIRQLKHHQSKLIAWPIAASQPTHWFLWTAAHTNNKSATVFFQITDQTALGHTTSHWQNQAHLATVGQMMAGICHEVNQPLNAMRLRIYGLQAMHQGGGIDKIDEHLKALDKQVRRCADTLSNMRDIVGRKSLNLGTFDASKSVDQIVKLLKHQFKLQQVQLSSTPNTTHVKSHFFVFGQAQQLEQVLINLIYNARDALLERPLIDGPANISIDLALEKDQGSQGVIINVVDNGPGIPLALQEKVFDAYYTSKTAQQGTGLGLALCRELMHDLGGKLTLSSCKGKTVFSLWLPAVASGDLLKPQ